MYLTKQNQLRAARGHAAIGADMGARDYPLTTLSTAVDVVVDVLHAIRAAEVIPENRDGVDRFLSLVKHTFEHDLGIDKD